MKPPLRVKVWIEPAASLNGVHGETFDAIEELAAELGTDAEIEYAGRTDSVKNYDTYKAYRDFVENVLLSGSDAGWQGLLIYDRKLNPDGGESYPNLGASVGYYRENESCVAVVNGRLSYVTDASLIPDPEDVYWNMIKHELMHSLLDGDRDCPGEQRNNDDHSCGAIDDGWVRQHGSPMVTGYFEPVFGEPEPSEICSGSISSKPPKWASELSDCTKTVGGLWLSSEYSNVDPTPPNCPPVCPTTKE